MLQPAGVTCFLANCGSLEQVCTIKNLWKDASLQSLHLFIFLASHSNECSYNESFGVTFVQTKHSLLFWQKLLLVRSVLSPRRTILFQNKQHLTDPVLAFQFLRQFPLRPDPLYWKQIVVEQEKIELVF